MKPVDQDKFYVEGVSRGNCLQAAVASVLGLPLDDVPNFHDHPAGFWPGYHRFLKEHGYIVVKLPPNWVPDCYYLAYGQSARGVGHAVVYRSGKLAHDPHRDRTGIVKVDEINLIVPIEISAGPSTLKALNVV